MQKVVTVTGSLYTHFSCPFCKATGTRSAATGGECKHPENTPNACVHNAHSLKATPSYSKWEVIRGDKYIREEIAISQAALNNHFSKLGKNDEPIYKNIECTIRKGTLYVKPTTRVRKKRGDNI